MNKHLVIIFFITLLIIVLIMCIYRPIKYNEKFVSDTDIKEENKYPRIPHIIWAFWNNPNTTPSLVNECFISWRRNNPTYSIIIVNDNTIFKFIDRNDLPVKFESIKSEQMKSDFIRLALLKRYGGIWIDASILMKKPLDKI